jgi:predicted ATP-grasp superfamily ATP-dependent carboligase/predicted protein tyrosine phosphatase
LYTYLNAYKPKAVLYPDPTFAPEDFLDFVVRISPHYKWIIPTMEKTQLPIARIADRLEETGVIAPIPKYDTLMKATNKTNILNLAHKNLIPTPPTLILNEAPRVDHVESTIGYPFIMKVSSEINVPPGPGERYFVVREKVQQEEIDHMFSKLACRGPVILQRYIIGTGLGASYIFNRYGQLISYFGHRRILEAYTDGGPSLIAETYLHPQALNYGFHLLRSLDWRGPAMVEFRMAQDGRLFFMELNPRFWGTLPLAAASGVDFPRLLLQNYENRLAKPAGPVRIRILLRARTLYLLMSALRMKDRDQRKRIITSISQVLKHGLPTLAESQEIGLKSLAKEVLSAWVSIMNKDEISRIGAIAFGPALPAQRLRRLNVQHVIDLRETSEKHIASSDNRNIDGIEIHNIPLTDDKAPDTDTFVHIISFVDQLLKNGRVYIHCRLGRGRTPTIVLGWLLLHGLDLDEAFALLYSRRPYSNPNLAQKESLYKLYRRYGAFVGQLPIMKSPSQ